MPQPTIEHAHAGRQSAGAEESLGPSSQEGRLLQETLLFVLGIPKYVVRCGH